MPRLAGEAEDLGERWCVGGWGWGQGGEGRGEAQGLPVILPKSSVRNDAWTV